MKKIVLAILITLPLITISAGESTFRVEVKLPKGRSRAITMKISDVESSEAYFNSLGRLSYDELYRRLYSFDYDKMAPLAELFREEQKRQNWSNKRLLKRAALFVQSLTFRRPRALFTDRRRRENYYDLYTPVQTLYLKEGDCDSKTLLLAIIIDRLGYETELLISDKMKHVILRVNLPGYDLPFYIDTTLPGMSGRLPAIFFKAGDWRVVKLNKN